MLKKLVAALAFLCASAVYAGSVDVNKASAAELDGVKGIGPSMSQRILDERKKGEFKNWGDLSARVKGIGEKKAAKLSDEGLRVGSDAYKTASTAPKAKEDKKAATQK